MPENAKKKRADIHFGLEYRRGLWYYVYMSFKRKSVRCG